MTVRRKDLKGAVKRGLLHRDALDGPVPAGGPRRWTCLACGRDVRRNGEVYPRLFGCGCCGLAWETEGLQRTVAAGGRAVLLQSGAVGIVRSMNGNMAVFVAEGGDAEGSEVDAKTLAPIYEHKTAHVQGCGHSPMPTGIGFTKQAIPKERPMAVKKFVPKGKPQAGDDVVARLVHIFSTAGGTTAAQAAVQVTDLGEQAAIAVAAFLQQPPKGYELQKRSGEGGALVYRLAPAQPGTEPGGTQQQEGTGMATKRTLPKKSTVKAKTKAGGKKVITARKAVSKKATGEGSKLSLREFLLTSIRGKPLTKEALLDACEKRFPDRTRAAMASTFSGVVGGNHVRIPDGWRILAKKADGVIVYTSEQTGKSA